MPFVCDVEEGNFEAVLLHEVEVTFEVLSALFPFEVEVTFILRGSRDPARVGLPSFFSKGLNFVERARGGEELDVGIRFLHGLHHGNDAFGISLRIQLSFREFILGVDRDSDVIDLGVNH